MTGERGRRVAKKVVSILRKEHGRHGVTVKRSALEELLMGVFAEGISERRAAAALASLTRDFVDWNEVRVSSVCEIAALFPDMPEAIEKAGVVRHVLQRVYDQNNEMTLDFLKEKGPRDAARLVADIEGFPESALARATLLALGQDVLPLTAGVVTVCRRMGLFSDGMDHAAMAHEAGKLIARPHMFEFHWLVSRHAASVCLPETPRCDVCSLRGECRSGRVSASSKASAGAARNGGKVGKGSRR